MNEYPVLEPRTAEDLYEHVRRIAPAYTEEWDPDSDDVGDTLVSLFAESAGEVVERLNRVPEKQFVAFLDELGFDRRPPQSARLPLTLTVTEDAPRNVVVPPGTQATAAATDIRPEQTFELEPGEGFEATPARLVDLYSVDPAYDQVFDHTSLLPDAAEREDTTDSGGTAAAASGPTAFFAGTDGQRHTLYLAHPDLLALSGGARVRVALRTTAPLDLLQRSLVWEYYGEEVVNEDEDPVEDWHKLTPVPSGGTTPVAPVDPETTAVKALVDDVDDALRDAGYAPAALDPEARAAVHERIAVEVFDRGLTLPPSLVPATDLDQGVADAIKARVRAAVAAAPYESRFTTERVVTLTFELGGTPTEREVGGVKSRWLRACVPDGRVPGGVFGVEYTAVWLGLEAREIPAEDLHLLADDVPLPTSGTSETEPEPIVPFGEEPQVTNAFYVASAEAFTKRGRKVTLTFRDKANTGNLGTDDGATDVLNPELSWEYWNGDAWANLGAVDKGTELLTEDGEVEFTVPDDLEPTTVAGHEGHWIRVRLTDGHYGKAKYSVVTPPTPPNGTPSNPPYYKRDTTDIQEPRYGSLTVQLADEADPPSTPLEHVLHENALAMEVADPQPPTAARPFRPLSDETQTLYAGFDGPLSNGPITLFVAATDRAFPVGFYPQVRWEYRADPDRDEWTPLGTLDGTEGFTERGIVRLTFPEETTPSTRFGRTRHWVRARVAGDQFVATLYVPAGPVGSGTGTGVAEPADAGDEVGEDDTDDAGESNGAENGDSRCGFGCGCSGTGGASGHGTSLPPCGATVPTLPPAGLPLPEPPAVTGLHPNTGWAANLRTVQREPVGSSDGTPNQRFAVSTPPVMDATVEVDELTARSEAERDAFLADRPDGVELVTGPSGDPRRFWVTWEAVPDFLDSAPTDRHYVLDRTAGTVRFGDGRTGAVPPIGRDNVRITYGTGGGAAGNVAAGAVTDLVSSLAFAEEVTNPVAGDGGADVETTAAVLERGPKELRDRNRAVVDVDFERLAHAASRKLARTRCLRAMNRAGSHEPGWVTLLLVPASGERMPFPTAALREEVERYVAARAPATLVAGDRLVVRGPSYVAASVTTELVVVPGASVSTVETAATEALDGFLHPLTGGPDAGGWPFGELPCRADLYGLLEGIPGVDHVVDLTLRFRGSGAPVTATEGEDPPSVAPDALVYSGTHDVTPRGGE